MGEGYKGCRDATLSFLPDSQAAGEQAGGQGSRGRAGQESQQAGGRPFRRGRAGAAGAGQGLHRSVPPCSAHCSVPFRFMAHCRLGTLLAQRAHTSKSHYATLHYTKSLTRLHYTQHPHPCPQHPHPCPCYTHAPLPASAPTHSCPCFPAPLPAVDVYICEIIYKCNNKNVYIFAARRAVLVRGVTRT